MIDRNTIPEPREAEVREIVRPLQAFEEDVAEESPNPEDEGGESKDAGRGTLTRHEVAGKPVYLALAMDEEGVLRMKPQNLLFNLPVAQQ